MLSTVTQKALMERAHSYKDKIAKGIDPSLSLFTYPVLMAADILCVNSDIVPVGKDQKQHLEMTRDIAQRFNNKFGEVFKLPEPMIQEDVSVIPGTDGEKMSKSYNNLIEIFGPVKPTRKKIMKIVTDSKDLEEAKDPDACNVVRLYKLFASDTEVAEMEKNYRAGGYGYGTAKKALAEAFEAHFSPMRARREELENNLDYVEQVLSQGAEKARAEIVQVMDTAQSDGAGLGMEESEKYAVRLDVFEGPLDLLLYLIKKDEVDIYDIPIVQITEQYNKYLDIMRMLDLNIAGEFRLCRQP